MNPLKSRAIAASVAAAFVVALGAGAQAAGAAPVSWYVDPAGSDANSCTAAAQPCATINGAIGKASAGDTINVAVGTYTGSGVDSVVHIDKDVTLTGGWNSTFTSRGGFSTVDGQDARKGILVGSAAARIERFLIENGNSTGYPRPGGGITVEGGSLELDMSTVRNSHAGGIWSEGPLTITNSTVSGNASNQTNAAGGITALPPSLIVRNSTISGNTGSGGGGINVQDQAAVQLSNVTIVGNSAYAGAGIQLDFNGGTLHLRNSIVAGNNGGSPADADFSYGLGWTVVSEGHNIETGVPPTSSDLYTSNPHVDVLADNGGPTDTRALLPDSPALDGGDPAGCNDENGLALDTDQRGIPRPLRYACDIGAFEAEPPPNDDFADATSIDALAAPISGSNEFATKEEGEPDHAATPGGASVWYSWTPPFSGTAFVSTAGSSFDTLVGVYTGSAVASLTTVAGNDDATTAALSSKACFAAAAGTAYKIAVDGIAAPGDVVPEQGSLTLTWGRYMSDDPCSVLPPTILGTPQVGQALTATTGTWAGTPSGFAYDWFACDSLGCFEIAGATSATYTPRPEQEGLQLIVRVTAKHPSDPTRDAFGYSGLTAPIAAAAPSPPPPPPPPPPPSPPPPPPSPPAPPPPPPPPLKCHVPAVKGKPLRVARVRIKAAHCSVGRIRYARSKKKRGLVIAQRPAAAKILPRGGRVNLVVSRGHKR